MPDTPTNRVDRERLEEIGMGDAEFTREIVQMMIDDGEERVRAIKDAYSQQSWEDVGREAHSLKGAALNVGANDLAKLCATIDDTVRKLKSTIEESSVTEVEAEFQSVRTELESIIASMNA
jgi:HPt (histidine-containing phosphotransfer) domain-containing protein